MHMLLSIAAAGMVVGTTGAGFDLTSTDFADGGMLPAACSCDGAGTAPSLHWSGAPAGTRSFVLTCVDPDAPRGDFVHWLVYDIPAETTGLEERLPAGAVSLPNDYGRPGYGPACPPSGVHRYVFTLYAMDTGALGGVDRKGLGAAIRAHQLGRAVLTGRYRRR